MGKLDFCPHDFRKFNRENLAYEIIFEGNWNWEEVQKKTVVGERKYPWIVTNDQRREKRYLRSSRTDTFILLEYEEGDPAKKNGLTRLIELIEKGKNEEQGDSEKRGKTEENRRNTGLDEIGLGEEDYEENTKENTKELKSAVGDFRTSSKIRLDWKKESNGVIVFVDADEDPVMRAFPCCPKCHNRLPLGWLEAEDFAPIALMAPSGSGKTTLLYSMMGNHWAAVKNPIRLGKVNASFGGTLQVSSGHEAGVADEPYHTMKLIADEMCKGGYCPDNSNRDYRIPPLFLQVKYEGHKLIIGFYDNSGENLKNMNLEEKRQLDILLEKMFAEMYLFEPKDLGVVLQRERKASLEEIVSKCKVMELEKQGAFQARSQNSCIAGNLLDVVYEEENTQKEDLMTVYNNHTDVMISRGKEDLLGERHFIGIISKCDLLENLDGIKGNPDYEQLFKREIPNDLLNFEAQEIRSELVKDMILNCGLMENDVFEMLGADHKTISWHCVSALGCDTEKESGSMAGGKLLGTYKPIRIAEPLVNCILKRIIENGWVKEKE